MAAINDDDSPKEENKEALNLINAAKALNSKKLDLSKRRILNLPTELQSLQQLEFLYLEGNLLQALPEELFTSLNQLKWLDLRNNKLQQLPSSIKEARFLRSLLLEENDLKVLPVDLGFVKSLSGLHLAGNPLEFPPSSIIEQGTQVILSFLRDCFFEKQNEEQESEEISGEDETMPYDKERRAHSSYKYSDRQPERRGSDPTGIASRSSEEKTPFNVTSSILSNPLIYNRKYALESINGGTRSSKGARRQSNKSNSAASENHREKKKQQKGKTVNSAGSAHEMKRTRSGGLSKESIESRIQEEMRQAEEKINNARIDSIIQKQKDKQLLSDWRRDAKKMQRDYMVSNQGLKYEPLPPPFGTKDQPAAAPSKHGQQVKEALENMDAGSLTKMTRDRDVIDKIEDHIRKMRIRRPSQDQYTPEEEVEKARNNLGEAIRLQRELEEKRTLEYRLRAFTAEDYAPPSHPLFRDSKKM